MKEAIVKWGLMMRAGRSDKKSKTKVLCAPRNRKIRIWRSQVDENTLTDDANFKSDLLLETPQKKVKFEKSHAEAPETDDIIVDDKDGVVKFNKTLTCLGSVINFELNVTVDAGSIVHKASKSVGSFRFAWDDSNAPLIIK